MKKTVVYKVRKKFIKREIKYIPSRFIFAGIITIFEILAIIAIVIGLCYYVPYFYIVAYITAIACELKIISSEEHLKINLITRFVRAIVRIFAPML